MSLHAGSGGNSGSASPLTTKGDIWGFDTADNRIPIGANTFVLTADSTQALGVKWAAASGGVTASGPPVAAQVAVWTSATDITGDTGLIYSKTNQSLGVGPAVVVATAETLSVIATETIASAAGATWDGINLQASTATITGTTTIATATGFNFVNIGRPTLTDGSAVTVTNAATLYISNAPLAAGSVTITNPYAMWVDNGNVRFDGTLIFTTGGTSNVPNIINESNTAVGFFLSSTSSGLAAGSPNLAITLNGSTSNRGIIYTTSATAGSAVTRHNFTVGADTLVTAGSEMLDFNFSFTAILQHASNTAVTTQRSIVAQPRTYSFQTATGTITTAATLAISGAPIAGTNAIITNSYALWIQAGTSAFDAQIKLTPIAAPSTQVNGHLYQDSTQKTLVSYESGVAVSKSGCIFTATADVALNNSAAETSMLGTGIGTKTLAANFLVIGKTVMVEIRGYYTTGATPQTLTFKLKLGANVIATVAAFAPPINQANTGFSINATMTCRTTGATGAIYGQGDVNFESGLLGVTSFAFLVAVATVAVDTTATQAVDMSLTTALADAGATYTSTDGVVEVLN